jgi:hypothetical protein
VYKIIGADGREYGPVSAEQLRQWMAEGRVNAQTSALAEGSTQWQLLGQFPEFASSAPTGMHASPPPINPPSSSAHANNMAVTGFVMGLIGITVGLLCCGPLFDILGIIFSCIGLSQIGKDPKQTGKGLAIAGLVLSILGLIASVGIGLLWGFRSIYGRHPMYFRQYWRGGL